MNRLKSSFFPKSRSLTPAELHKIYLELHKHYGHQSWWPGETPLEIIVGAILTQNTAWTNVEKAIQNLKKHRALSVTRLRLLTHDELAKLIRPSGYFNVKAKRIKAFIQFLDQAYQGSLQKMSREDGETLREKLLRVNGIGPETADSILLYAFEKPFFVIDAYTKRIFSRHQIQFGPNQRTTAKGAPTASTAQRTKRGAAIYDQPYESWQALFQSSLPREIPLFNDYHAQVVMLAKSHCKSRQPLCEGCPLETYL